MLLLASTDSLQLNCSVACDLDVIGAYFDASSANPPVTQGDTSAPIVATVTASGVTSIVSAPASTELRNIRELSIRNVHASTTVTVAIEHVRSGTAREVDKYTLVPGAKIQYCEGLGWFLIQPTTLETILRLLDADAAGSNVATAQPWFPSSGAAAVAAGTAYWMDGILNLTRAAGTTSHTTSMLFGGTATLTAIQYQALSHSGDTEAVQPAQRTIARVATATVIKAASTSATETISIKIDGIVKINAAGTFIPQFQYSAAPGGAPTVKALSHFRLAPIGPNSLTALGTWT